LGFTYFRVEACTKVKLDVLFRVHVDGVRRLFLQIYKWE